MGGGVGAPRGRSGARTVSGENEAILIVSSSAEFGGAELSLLPVAHNLVAQSRRVIAYLPAEGPLDEELRSLGVETRLYPLSTSLRRASRQAGGASFAATLARALPQQISFARALRTISPRVVYANGFRAQLAVTLAARLCRIPVVWHVRDFVSQGQLGRAWSLLSRLATVVITNSEATARQPLLARAEVVAIPNGIDLSRFSLRQSEPTGEPVVGMAGHLTRWKGHVRFLEVVAALRGLGYDVRAAIAGGDLYDTGPHATYAAELVTEIDRLGLAEVVRVEHVAPVAMQAWLTDLTLLIHCPDLPEPFGRILAEALAVGVPIVSAAGPGAEEVVGDAGVIVPLGETASIVAASRSLLDDPGRRRALAAEGRRRVTARFDENAYAQKVAASVLGAGRSAS